MQFAESFKRQAVLGRDSGIPVRADYGWFFVVGLMSAITGASVNPLVGNIAGSVVLGIATTLIFFASIFLHEFAHAVAARWETLDVVEIVLHPFGGMTRFRHPPETPPAEFRIAIAGPAASFLLTLLFLGLMAAANAGGLDILATLLFLLALSNFLLAVLRGGGALLDGVDQYIRSFINLAVGVAEEPRYATVNGLVRMFDDPKLLEKVSRNELGVLQNAEIPFEA